MIGWTITSSPFQRRAGLVTIHATTAANKGAYPIYDIDEDDGLRFAAEAVPGPAHAVPGATAVMSAAGGRGGRGVVVELSLSDGLTTRPLLGYRSERRQWRRHHAPVGGQDACQLEPLSDVDLRHRLRAE